MTWKNKALLIGVILGAVTGLGAALLYIRSVEDTGSEEPHKVKTGDAIMLSISLANIIRQVAKLAG
jgi:hypothetical protein